MSPHSDTRHDGNPQVQAVSAPAALMRVRRRGVAWRGIASPGPWLRAGLVGLVLSACIAGGALAQTIFQHALIIGVSRYADPAVPPLDGIPHDMKSARDIARAMGIPPNQVTELRDAQATKPRIIEALNRLFRDSTDGGRILVYFSGHGTRWLDPSAGGCVEGLLTYDGQAIVNREFASLLQPIGARADKLIIMFDACHSGGVAAFRPGTRSFALGLRPKFFVKASQAPDSCSRPVNMRTRSLLGGRTGTPGALPENVVQITSSRPDEVSFDDAATGGLATQGVRDCLLGKARDLDASGAVTLAEVEQCAQEFVRERVKPFPDLLPHHVSVSGLRNLIVQPAGPRPSAAAGAAMASAPTEAAVKEERDQLQRDQRARAEQARQEALRLAELRAEQIRQEQARLVSERETAERERQAAQARLAEQAELQRQREAEALRRREAERLALEADARAREEAARRRAQEEREAEAAAARVREEQARLQREWEARQRLLLERERLERERIEKERLAAAERDRLAREREAAEQQRLAELAMLEREAAERERARQQRAEEERLRQQQAAEERARQQRAEEERLRQQRAAEERARLVRAEEERARRERAAQEQDRQAREREAAEQQRLARLALLERQTAEVQREREESARRQRAEIERIRQEQAAEEKARQPQTESQAELRRSDEEAHRPSASSSQAAGPEAATPQVLAAVDAASSSASQPVAMDVASEPAATTVVGAVAALRDLHEQRDRRRQVEVRPSRTALKIGRDPLELTITSSHEGYLYILLLGSDEKSFYLLYPNGLDRNNRVGARVPVTLPRPSWQLVAAGPPGTDHLLVIVTDRPRDLSTLTQAPADASAPFSYTAAHTQGRRALIDFIVGAGVGQGSSRFGAEWLTIEELP